MDIPKMSANQRTTLFYVDKHETNDYGVIVRHVTGEALMRRGWASEARRRKFARDSGLCLQLTDEGRKVCRMIEGTW